MISISTHPATFREVCLDKEHNKRSLVGMMQEAGKGPEPLQVTGASWLEKQCPDTDITQ